jgi:hypothetical protein
MKRDWTDDPTSIRYRLRRYLHKLSGGLVDHPLTVGSLRYFRERDPEYNRESTPSEDEHIEVLSLWALEMYTPSTIGSLEQGLRRLRWGETDWFGREDPVTWLQRSRAGHSGGWLNLGDIRRPGQQGTRVRPEPLRAPLPYFAEYAHARLYSLTPSITCLAICFVLKIEERTRVEKAMRQPYSTFIKHEGRARTVIQPPNHQKINQIKTIRERWRETTAAWLREHMPGVLSRNSTGCDLPTCEFTVLEGIEPFSSGVGKANTLLALADLWTAPYIFEDQTPHWSNFRLG